MWWRNLRGGAPVQVYLRGAAYHGDAETTTDPDATARIVGRGYPALSAERRERFAAGKAAILVRLREVEAL